MPSQISLQVSPARIGATNWEAVPLSIPQARALLHAAKEELTSRWPPVSLQRKTLLRRAIAKLEQGITRALAG